MVNARNAARIILTLCLCLLFSEGINSEKYPIRSVIVAKWRTGSTFLGKILDSLAGSFYIFEPLILHSNKIYRESLSAKDAVDTVKSLLKCNFSNAEQYIELNLKNRIDSSIVSIFLDRCGSRNICWAPSNLMRICEKFPYQSMKLVRFSLALAAEELLSDKSLNLKIIYLVRDPRAIINSRMSFNWCTDSPDCREASILCADMVDDYHTAKMLQKEYPNRFRAIRYEDFIMDINEGVNYVFDFYGLPVTEHVRKYLKTHTKTDRGDEYSTYRNSKEAAFRWRLKLTYDRALGIQENCKEALKLWDYNLLTKKSELGSNQWSPITNSSITRATYLL